MKTELKKLYEGDIPTVTMLRWSLRRSWYHPYCKKTLWLQLLLLVMVPLGGDQQVYVFQDQWEKASEILSELNLSQE